MSYADLSPKSPWFSRENSALVLIDHQTGTMQLVKNIASDATLRNAVLLAKAAKTLGMPMRAVTDVARSGQSTFICRTFIPSV